MSETLPDSPLVTVKGPIDGNAFAIIGAVSKTLKREGFKGEAVLYQSQALNCGSYDKLLTLSQKYANFAL